MAKDPQIQSHIPESKSQQAESSTQEKKHEMSFGEAINTYVSHLDSIMRIFPLTMETVLAKDLQETQHIEDFLKSNSVKIENDTSQETQGSSESFYIKEENIIEFTRLTQRKRASDLALEFLPTNFVVSFVSQYDAYLGNLIKTIFFVKPQALNSSEKNISFTDLVNYGSIEVAKDYIVEKEVESVLRENHVSQFDWLEKKADVKLREGLSSFKKFVEITERRNLFVHTNGIVSRQYISSCTKQKVDKIDNVKLGQRLSARPPYLKSCYEVLFEIGVKLGQVLWRKLEPNKLKDADANLNSICYDLLIDKKFDLAINILSFATETLPRNYSQEWKYTFTINKALAYYLSGKTEESKHILDKTDWSATNDKFRLALSVLEEDFETASEIILSIGANNKELSKNSYREWPLFTNFRKTELFKSTYKTVFNEDFVHVENKPTVLTEIAKSLRDMVETDEKKRKE